MVVGQAISMVDSHLRVSGSIDYTLNFELPRMLHACMLRSPHAHARVVKVDDKNYDLAGRLIEMDDLDRGMLGLYLSTQPLAA